MNENMEKLSELKIIRGNKIGIFLFGGKEMTFGGIKKIEIVNLLAEKFTNCDIYCFVDKKKEYFHNGINNITENIETTTEYLKRLVSKYKKAIFAGAVGMGGYASILYGSLLNVNIVIAFLPTTKLEKNNNLNIKYIDLKKRINNKTIYHIYANRLNNSFDLAFSHSENIDEYPNVFINKYDNLNVFELYESGELLKIFAKHIPPVKTKCCC